jgi:hypothetical protein
LAEKVSKWALLLDAIGHVASVRGISDQRAFAELRGALRDGAVESRRLGEDENIAPTDWYRTLVLPDGSVIFNYDGRFGYKTPILDRSHPDYLVSYHVEVRRADVLRIWLEKPIEVLRRPSITPHQRREKRILRFQECQKRRRRWLGFWDIADWIACDRGATDRRDEQLRAQGYSDLFDAILTGHFDQHGRRCVLYLSPDSEKLPLIAERLREMRDNYAGTTTMNDEVLARCWVPRSLAQRWFERREIPWPARFDPVPEKSPRAYDPNEPLTLADQLRLLVEQGVAEDEAKVRLAKTFRLRGRSIYSPKYAVSYEEAKIDWKSGRVVLRRLPRQPFTPTLTVAEHFVLFPQPASAPVRINEAAGLTAGERPSAGFPSQRVEASGKRATSTASYSEVRSAIENHGPGTEKQLLTAVGKAAPGKCIPRQRVRDARDDLFGKPGRTGRPKSPK